MKLKTISLTVLALCILLAPVQSLAGTFLLGTKAWYETTWDSAVLDIYARILAQEIKNNEAVNFTEMDYDTFVGTGYMAGPVFAFQTDNGKWSFSVAPMVISDFEQDLYGTSFFEQSTTTEFIEDLMALTAAAMGYDYDEFTSLIEYDPTLVPDEFEVNIKTEVKVSRIDLDFAASYSLADAGNFLRYWKLFAGLKYQKVDYEFKYTTRILSEVLTGKSSFDYEVYIPSLGAGIFYPFSNQIVASAQAGVGIAHFEDNDADDGLALNFEANVTISPLKKTFVQFGYRYQEFAYDMKDSETGKRYEATDRTWGPTLTLVYNF